MNAAVFMAHIYTSNIGNRAIYYISILTLSLNLQTVYFVLYYGSFSCHVGNLAFMWRTFL